MLPSSCGYRALTFSSGRLRQPLRIAASMAPSKRSSSSNSSSSHSSADKPMLQFQESLARLPVPTLEQTATRYLQSLAPILSASEYTASKAAVEKFVAPGGIGHKLQDKLVARRNDPSVKNWLYEWWTDSAYLSYRDPVVPYVSYFFSFRDDRSRRDPTKRAASIVAGVLEFKQQVDDGTLKPEMMRKQPLCMDSYKWMFNAARVAARPADHPVKFAASDNKHLIVIRKNQFFKIPHEIDGKRLNLSELEAQFSKVYEMAKASGPAVGALTSENRDVWADARELLTQSSAANKEALRAIDSASFVVCLDDASPITLEERAHQYLHGDGANRWFDKPLQFIINDNGTAGFLGEHSMMDATPTNNLIAFVSDLIFSKKLDVSDSSVRSNLSGPQLVPFEVTPQVQAQIDRAVSDFQTLISQHHLVVQSYQGYGGSLIKQFKCSPDAYVQMLIQLAYFRMHGKSRPTYESAATRRYQLGRTETCRSVTNESVAWCTAMADVTRSDEARRELLTKAMAKHASNVSEASSGNGVDRHLFGLKKLLQEGEEVPDIYKDPAYTYSGSWYLSTSQLSSPYYNTWGFSQVVDDGFGVAYMINPNSINFNIVSKGLRSDLLSYYLSEAAGEMRDLLLPTVKEPKAKL